MGSGKPRYTLTGTHFVQTRPVRAGTETAPTHPIPAGRAYIGRMSWNLAPGLRTTAAAEHVATVIRDTALPGATFFPDTCFLTSPLDDRIWQALLHRKIVLTRLVHDELQSWLANPRANAVLSREFSARLASGDEHVGLTPRDAPYEDYGYGYYCPLLLLRKLKGVQFGEEFRRREGRPPSKDEFYRAYKLIGQGYDDRAVRLAWKGYTDYHKPNYAADEQLVTIAVLHALMTGRETTILTRDHDLMEQFYKLVFLIDTHYRGMLFADRYALAPSNYQTQNKRTIIEGRPEYFDDRFVGDDDVFMRPNLPDGHLWVDLLPVESGWVNVGCWWFGDGPDKLQHAQLVFCADTEIARVLRIKGSTGGLNTDQLGGRNCHVWPHPGLENLLGACVAVAEDRMVNYHPKLPPLRALDMIHAVASRERFDRYKIVDAKPNFPRWSGNE